MIGVQYIVDCKINQSQVVIRGHPYRLNVKSKSKYTQKMETKSFLIYLSFSSHPNDMGLVGKTVFHVYTLSPPVHSKSSHYVIMSLEGHLHYEFGVLSLRCDLSGIYIKVESITCFCNILFFNVVIGLHFLGTTFSFTNLGFEASRRMIRIVFHDPIYFATNI